MPVGPGVIGRHWSSLVIIGHHWSSSAVIGSHRFSDAPLGRPLRLRSESTRPSTALKVEVKEYRREIDPLRASWRFSGFFGGGGGNRVHWGWGTLEDHCI